MTLPSVLLSNYPPTPSLLSTPLDGWRIQSPLHSAVTSALCIPCLLLHARKGLVPLESRTLQLQQSRSAYAYTYIYAYFASLAPGILGTPGRASERGEPASALYIGPRVYPAARRSRSERKRFIQRDIPRTMRRQTSRRGTDSLGFSSRENPVQSGRGCWRCFVWDGWKRSYESALENALVQVTRPVSSRLVARHRLCVAWWCHGDGHAMPCHAVR